MYERLTQKMIHKRLGEKEIHNPLIFWSAEAFNIDNTDFYRSLDKNLQIELVNSLSQEVIEESIFIERTAMDFASYMSLNGENEEQQEIYALMNSDEIDHYFMLKKFMNRPLNSAENNLFMQILNEVMSTKSKPIMVFFGQVLLEGLSIQFYRDLLPTCENEDLKKVVKRIYMDEASHHSIGVATMKTDLKVSDQEKNKLYDFIAAYLKLQQSLYPRMIQGLEKVSGGLTLNQKKNMFHQMRSTENVQESINRVISFLKFDLSQGFLEKLEKQGLLMAPKEYVEV